MAQIITTAGIDVSKATLDIALWPDETVTLHVDRGQADCFDKLAAWLSEHEVRPVGLEASGGYEIAVMDALQARGFDVVRFNAQRIRMFAKAAGRLAKNDRADAIVIPSSGYSNGFAAGTLASLAQATAVLSVKQPKARPRPLDPLVELLNYRRRLSDGVIDCTNQLEHLADKALRRSAERRRTGLDRELAEIDKKLAAMLAASGSTGDLAQRLRSVPGVGPVLSTTLVALLPELGALSRRKIASLVGVAPFDDDSGKRRGARCIQGGRAKVRRVLFMATQIAIRHNPAIAAFARRLAGKEPKVIITACMRKLLVILNAIARDRTEWKDQAA
jgi:transposase